MIFEAKLLEVVRYTKVVLQSHIERVRAQPANCLRCLDTRNVKTFLRLKKPSRTVYTCSLAALLESDGESEL